MQDKPIPVGGPLQWGHAISRVLSFLLGIVALSGLTFAGHAATSNTQKTVVAQTTTKTDKNAKQKSVKRTTSKINYNGWVVTCVKIDAKAKETCSAQFRVIKKKNKKILMSWLIGYTKKNVLVTELFTPSGVLIEPGVELVIDKKLSVKALYKSCGPRGCKSRLVMSKKLRARFAKAKTVSVKVNSTDGRVISFNLGFKGFARALKDITR